MHVGIATAATAALVFSGAALFQGGPPTPPAPPAGSGPVATAPVAVGSTAEAELSARVAEMSRALAESRGIIAQQERELARALGEVDSMHTRVKVAEGRAAALEAEMFEAHRAAQVAREEAARTKEELGQVMREREAAKARADELLASVVSVPPSPPATYVPPTNPAWDALRAVRVDMARAATLNAVMAQTAVREGKIMLAQPKLGEMELDPSGNVLLPDRPMNLAEILEAVNAGIANASLSLVPRTMPDGRTLIAPQEGWDRADRVLVIYDLSDIAERDRARARTPSPFVLASSVQQLHGVIVKTVTPSLWQDNGGDLATLSTLDSSLVVTAPERSHHQIRWIIEQMRGSASSARSASDVPVLSDLPLLDESRVVTAPDGMRVAQPVERALPSGGK